ncbi:MAG: hypothetical protein DPW11_04765 [bacterium]|nr:hypothetical protein [Candidatus Microgenomates bacterium CPR3]MCQ3945054.1 hypothetical protein [bacterium]RIK51304.1 MAG: hypothetical protein DCC61_02980 [Candidatus Microgenomates bacterium]
MPKKKVTKKAAVKKVVKSSMSPMGIRNNQFFGLLLIAVGLGALVVVVRYFVISLQVPTSVYEISPSELIPGATK